MNLKNILQSRHKRIYIIRLCFLFLKIILLLLLFLITFSFVFVKF